MKRVVLGALVIGLAAAPAAQGATRYAAPMAAPGADPAVCAQAGPCDIQTAVEHASVMDGDDMVVTPGTYMETDVIEMLREITVHGQAGQPRPTIVSTAFNAIYLADPNRTLRDVVIEHSGGNTGVLNFGGVAERVLVQASNPAGYACTPLSGGAATPALFRDSVCWNTAAGGAGVGSNANSLAQGGILRNVTAIAPGAGGNGIDLDATLTAAMSIDARNVIADGGPGGFDIQATTDASGTPSATVTLVSSNYDSEDEGANPGAAVTNPGTGTNQTAAPQFVNAAMGDFHQLATSPTIDAGSADGAIGMLDLDRNPRSVQGKPGCPNAQPDIGAFEAPAVTAADCGAPEPPASPAAGKPKSKCKKAKKKRGKAAAKKKGCKKRRKRR